MVRVNVGHVQLPAGTPDAPARLAEIGEIAAEIAHELRNLLQIIATNAFLARQSATDSGVYLGRIEKNATLAQHVVNDLLALARGDAMHVEETHVVDLLLLARDEAIGAAEWDDRIEPKDLRVTVHIGLAVRILHVLYENAILASRPRAPSIVTHARRHNDSIVIDVSDDGPGIAEELEARVFEPLVSGREGGSGLGLALARRIAHAHRGVLTLERGERGACFRLALPL